VQPSEKTTQRVNVRAYVMKTHQTDNIADGQLVDANTLLKIIFPANCRPTLRWLRDQQERRTVPFRKIGRLVFFDPEEVRQAWRDRFTVGKAPNA